MDNTETHQRTENHKNNLTEILELKITVNKISVGWGESCFNNRLDTHKEKVSKESRWLKESIQNKGETKEWKICFKKK